MAKYRVIYPFWDSELHRRREKGEVIEMDEKRVEELLLDQEKVPTEMPRGEMPKPDPQYTRRIKKLEKIDGRSKAAKEE